MDEPRIVAEIARDFPLFPGQRRGKFSLQYVDKKTLGCDAEAASEGKGALLSARFSNLGSGLSNEEGGMFGFWEGVIVLLLVLIVLGGKQLPELGRSVGKMIRNVKDEVSETTIVQVSPQRKEG